ncbi:TPA: hypothetical protein DEP21_00820 [Patescibacteria group bacterium]|nr:hypothetical protein [Candidatus Gracilibacteria bacterium]
MLQAPITYPANNPLKQARDEAILNMLYGTGLRVSELISLKITDIKIESNQFTVIGK